MREWLAVMKRVEGDKLRCEQEARTKDKLAAEHRCSTLEKTLAKMQVCVPLCVLDWVPLYAQRVPLRVSIFCGWCTTSPHGCLVCASYENVGTAQACSLSECARTCTARTPAHFKNLA